jgi:hypothetical protein
VANRNALLGRNPVARVDRGEQHGRGDESRSPRARQQAADVWFQLSGLLATKERTESDAHDQGAAKDEHELSKVRGCRR